MRTKDESKHTAIREKAIGLIVEHGFDGLSMQKLADAAGISPATIYIFYRNREDLLNSLFNEVQELFSQAALRDFDPGMSLEEGLWRQWKNRFDFIIEHPSYFRFFEQFRNSPLINHKDVCMGNFKHSMREFVHNAVRHGQLARMDPETFWALAYGPFYALVKFHLQNRSMMNDSYSLTTAKMKVALSRVVRSLKP
jgi:TetR/AcrR family transcriptional regulator, multidrug resistance operon repressor